MWRINFSYFVFYFVYLIPLPFEQDQKMIVQLIISINLGFPGMFSGRIIINQDLIYICLYYREQGLCGRRCLYPRRINSFHFGKFGDKKFPAKHFAISFGFWKESLGEISGGWNRGFGEEYFQIFNKKNNYLKRGFPLM